jgi:ABC-type sugar transport system permease subunit
LFIGIGAFGGAVAGYLYSTAFGQFLVQTMALGVGTILTVISVVVTIQVLRLERNTGKEIFISDGGLSLE